MNGSRSTAPHAQGRQQSGHLSRAPKEKELARVLQAFNTWAFKREQPSDLGVLTRTVARSLMKSEPISFALYWGKGPRSEIAGPELDCLDYLASLAARVRGVYRYGADINLILTNTHAMLNGHSSAAIASYFSEVDVEAHKRSFKTFLLSDLCEAMAPSEAAEVCSSVPEDVLQRLARSAERWYRGEGDALDGALKYYQMNMTERLAVEHVFPSSIFVTFNGSDQRDLFPEKLPIFYMYSVRRGTSVKPWFIPASKAATLTAVSLPTHVDAPCIGRATF